MQQATAIQPSNISNSNGTYFKSEDQFSELMNEINYAKALLGSKTWTLAQYYNHMADFHDYINDPAPNLRILADKWLQEHSG